MVPVYTVVFGLEGSAGFGSGFTSISVPAGLEGSSGVIDGFGSMGLMATVSLGACSGFSAGFTLSR